METLLGSRSLGEESLQMWDLNKRLEAYLARVKYLEEENEVLRAEIQTLRGAPQESAWKGKYEGQAGRPEGHPGPGLPGEVRGRAGQGQPAGRGPTGEAPVLEGEERPGGGPPAPLPEQEGGGGGEEGPAVAEGESRPAGEGGPGPGPGPPGGGGRPGPRGGRALPEPGGVPGRPAAGRGLPAGGGGGLCPAALRPLERGSGDLQGGGLSPGGLARPGQGEPQGSHRRQPAEPAAAATAGERAGRPHAAEGAAGGEPGPAVAAPARGGREAAGGHRVLGGGEAVPEGPDCPSLGGRAAADAPQNVPQPGSGHLPDPSRSRKHKAATPGG
ncbi:hypothetical protein JRQ81_009143 [Phrynocephalus forsythii]|uniref:IF rod domain-containing protein n=1 Tax=Phrynocephalus forsythii TaxID=171643 RepID=A0A9Q1ASA6_9SAUR|nr:hypothetical protein JRQ81_009143 [Phrynocephalus forsythii]